MSDMNIHDEMFMALMLNLQMSAMVGMGKVHHPATNKIERNMQEAKAAIDMLEMLEAKTKGNLGENEEKLIAQLLTELRLNYVNEVNKPEETPEEKVESKEEPEKSESSEEK